MRREMVLRPVAERELSAAVAWYEKEQEGLGREFLATIEDYFLRIAAHPNWFPEVRGKVRRAVVRRFPFAIHFLIEPKRIVILSVFHTSRDPERLKSRR